MFPQSEFYIDLGTANTLIYSKGQGFLLNEPSVIGLRNHSQVVALGRQAKKMLGKTPDNLNVVHPLRDGVIADFASTEKMLAGFFHRLKNLTSWRWPKMVISLPCQVTYYEKKAVKEVALSLGAKQVYLIEEPVAAAIGANLPVLKSQGSMVVDIGGGTTEIAIIACGGIIFSKAVRIGGDKIDEDIIAHIQHKHRFLIGPQTAERIKIEYGFAIRPNENLKFNIQGRNLYTGLPGIRAINALDVYYAMQPTVQNILDTIHEAFEGAPPEIVGDIISQGIILAGGGALIKNFPELIQSKVNVPVKVANQPLLSIALGGAKALNDSSILERIVV